MFVLRRAAAHPRHALTHSLTHTRARALPPSTAQLALHRAAAAKVKALKLEFSLRAQRMLAEEAAHTETALQ